MTTGRINQVNIRSFFFPRVPKHASTLKNTMQTKVCIVFFKIFWKLICIQIRTNVFQHYDHYLNANKFSLQKLFPRTNNAQLKHHAEANASSQCCSFLYCLILFATQNNRNRFGTNTSEQYSLSNELYNYA